LLLRDAEGLMKRMTLEEAVKHAGMAHAWGLDMSYSADEDALSTLLEAYLRLKEAHDVCIDNAEERRFHGS
jgi:hypothetical protein